MAATSMMGGQDRDAVVRSLFFDVERNGLSFLARLYSYFLIPNVNTSRSIFPKFSANR
jgi:hypothetical protein